MSDILAGLHRMPEYNFLFYFTYIIKIICGNNYFCLPLFVLYGFEFLMKPTGCSSQLAIGLEGLDEIHFIHDSFLNQSFLGLSGSWLNGVIEFSLS